jgi:hypothetical protein
VERKTPGLRIMWRETAAARMRVEDAETAVPEQQEDIKHAEITGLTNREREKSLKR